MGFKKFFSGECLSYRILVPSYVGLIIFISIFSAPLFKRFYSFTNISDSMNPVITTGSLTIVKKFNSYQEGDIIAYKTMGRNPEIITHRITGMGGNVYVTKGDANQVDDREIVLPRLIIGKVILIIPYLGHFITFTKSDAGTFLLVLLPAMLIICIESAKIFRTFRQ